MSQLPRIAPLPGYQPRTKYDLASISQGINAAFGFIGDAQRQSVINERQRTEDLQSRQQERRIEADTRMAEKQERSNNIRLEGLLANIKAEEVRHEITELHKKEMALPEKIMTAVPMGDISSAIKETPLGPQALSRLASLYGSRRGRDAFLQYRADFESATQEGREPVPPSEYFANLSRSMEAEGQMPEFIQATLTAANERVTTIYGSYLGERAVRLQNEMLREAGQNAGPAILGGRWDDALSMFLTAAPTEDAPTNVAAIAKDIASQAMQNGSADDVQRVLDSIGTAPPEVRALLGEQIDGALTRKRDDLRLADFSERIGAAVNQAMPEAMDDISRDAADAAAMLSPEAAETLKGMVKQGYIKAIESKEQIEAVLFPTATAAEIKAEIPMAWSREQWSTTYALGGRDAMLGAIDAAGQIPPAAVNFIGDQIQGGQIEEVGEMLTVLKNSGIDVSPLADIELPASMKDIPSSAVWYGLEHDPAHFAAALERFRDPANAVIRTTHSLARERLNTDFPLKRRREELYDAVPTGNWRAYENDFENALELGLIAATIAAGDAVYDGMSPDLEGAISKSAMAWAKNHIARRTLTVNGSSVPRELYMPMGSALPDEFDANDWHTPQADGVRHVPGSDVVTSPQGIGMLGVGDLPWGDDPRARSAPRRVAERKIGLNISALQNAQPSGTVVAPGAGKVLYGEPGTDPSFSIIYGQRLDADGEREPVFFIYDLKRGDFMDRQAYPFSMLPEFADWLVDAEGSFGELFE